MFLKPEACECVNEAVGASSASAIRLEQFLFVKTLMRSAREGLNSCIPSRTPHGSHTEGFLSK